jgi:hypothetical protein
MDLRNGLLGCGALARSAAGLASLILAALLSPGGTARGQEPAAPPAASKADTVRPGTPSRDRVTFIRDGRLEADSTLFPYEWPALEALRIPLARLRPALEAGSVSELALALPDVRARVDLLVADTIPSLLTPRLDEVRGRVLALGDALRRVEDLEAAALAAPADTSRPLEFEDWGAPADPSVTLSQPSGVESPSSAAESPGQAPTDTEPAADSLADSLAADSMFALDPIGSYLEAWREIYAHEEALLHRVRDPFGE